MKSVVLTGDIAGSTLLRPAKKKKLLQLMEASLATILQEQKKITAEIFRGDSLQIAWKKNAAEALRYTLWLHMELIRHGFHIRTGVGIGAISLQTGKPGTSDGTAFQLSGALLDQIKPTPQLIAIDIAGASHSEWEAHSTALNFVLQRCTAPQAAALSLMLQNKTQQEAAAILSIKQPAVHQRLQAGGWPVLQAVIKRFNYITAPK